MGLQAGGPGGGRALPYFPRSCLKQRESHAIEPATGGHTNQIYFSPPRLRYRYSRCFLVTCHTGVSPENLFIPEFGHFLADRLKFRPTGADALRTARPLTNFPKPTGKGLTKNVGLLLLHPTSDRKARSYRYFFFGQTDVLMSRSSADS